LSFARKRTVTSGSLAFSAASVWATGLIATALLASSAWPQTTSDGAGELLSEGLSLMHSGDFEAAITKLQQATRLSPGSAAAHYNLALALVASRREDEAIPELKSVVALNPRLEAAHYDLGILLEHKGQFAGALEQFKEFHTLRPDDTGARVHIIYNDFKLGNETEGMELVHQMLQEQPTAAVRAQVGILLADSGHSAEALKPLQQAAKEMPDVAVIHFNLGQVLLHSPDENSWHDGEKEIEIALQLSPREPKYYETLGTWYLERRDLEHASALFKRGIQEIPTSASLYLMLGIAEADLHGTATAKPYIEKAIELDPNAALGYNLLGNLYLRLGDYEHALPNYQKAATLSPNSDLYSYDVALVLERMNHIEEAIPYAQNAIRLKPDRSPAHYILGKLYSKLGRNNEAIRELEMCVRLNPQADAAYYLLARTNLKLGHRSEAEGWSRRFDELKTEQDRRVGLSGPANQAAGLLDVPVPWNRVP